jgi:beta-lactamase superfamily II metal-dependent hydrolase
MRRGNRQRAIIWLCGSVFVLVALASLGRADTVTPTERAVNGVVVRRGPSTDSARIGALSPGDAAELIETQGAWRKVRLANQRTGYVSSGWTEVIAGPAASGIVFRPVSEVSKVPHEPPPEGAYRVHLIDVGTGLSILVQGHTFNLLYDGGSNDDFAGITGGHNSDRLIAYLFAALGPSGPPECVPDGDPPPAQRNNLQRPIEHVFLSHPHRDHGALLNDVLHCYAVSHVWDSGVVNDTAFYKNFVQAIADEPGVSYHTAVSIPASRVISFDHSGVTMPSTVTWTTFGEGEQRPLDAHAHFSVLHVDPATTQDLNANSIVVRLDLGSRSILLTGDTTNGKREDHDTAPTGAEKDLVDHHAQDIHVDVLQVAHHGSKTSTRAAFLAAVSPHIALIGSGPKKYGSVVLPDAEVVTALEAAGAKVLRTDDTDSVGCQVADRIGRDDGSPGGCDNWILDVLP